LRRAGKRAHERRRPDDGVAGDSVGADAIGEGVQPSSSTSATACFAITPPGRTNGRWRWSVNIDGGMFMR
jgi:hypothetical protein